MPAVELDTAGNILPAGAAWVGVTGVTLEGVGLATADGARLASSGWVASALVGRPTGLSG